MSTIDKNTAILDETIKQLHGSAFARYLKAIKKNYEANPFVNDGLLCEVVLTLFSLDDKDLVKFNLSHTTVDYPAMEAIANFYHILAPLGDETKDIDKIKRLFINSIRKDGYDHFKYFNRELYDSFSDKESYLRVMSFILDNPTLIQSIPSINGYISKNKDYFTNNESFETNLFKVMKEIVFQGSLSPVRQRELLVENQKRAGIYALDEMTLEKVDAKLNGVNSIIGVLDSKVVEANLVIANLQAKLLDFREVTAKMLDDVTKTLALKVQNAVSEFSASYNNYLLKEKNSLTAQKDSLVRELLVLFEKKMGELIGISDSITKNADSEIVRVREEGRYLLGELNGISDNVSKNALVEISRVNEEGNIILGKLKSLVDGNPELQKFITEYKDNTKFLESISQLKALVEKTGSSNNVKSKGQVLDFSPVCYYFDTSKPYRERWASLMQKKAKMESEGIMFHEKFSDVLAFIVQDKIPYLWGPSGCGKTYMIKMISNFLGLGDALDIGKINESYDLLGSLTVTGEYNKPLFFQGYVKGNIVLIDELDGTFADAALTLNNFAGNEKGYVFPYVGFVKRGPNNRLAAAGNTNGSGATELFSGRYKLEESLQQRLKMVHVDYDSRVDQFIFTNRYSEWFEFSELFRQATTRYSIEKLQGSPAPGIFTTRDVKDVKDYLDNQSFTIEKILEYEFVQNKPADYLRWLISFIETNGKNVSKAAKVLVNTFVSEAEKSIRRWS